MNTLSHSVVKKEFLLQDDAVYLNCANMSPLLRTVRDAGAAALEKRASPWSIKADDWFADGETLRNLVAQLFGSKADDVALVSSVSYGLAVAAKNLEIPSGKSIVILEDQFPSNVYVWQEMALQRGLKVKTVRREASRTLTASLLSAIDEHTGLVAIPNCHWIDGALVDLHAVGRATKDVGAALVLDLSQSLGVLPINIKEIDPDFAVAVGYKWQLGPYGLAYLYVSPRYHSGTPLEYSWLARKGSDDFSTLTAYTAEYKKGGRRFDMGESAQFHLLPMAIEAVRQILKWEVPKIQSTIATLTIRVEEFTSGRLTEHHVARAGHMVNVPMQLLNDEKTKQRLKENNIVVSFRNNSIRISPYLYNSEADIQLFLECLC